MRLEFYRQESAWPSSRLVFHAARDAFVVSEAKSRGGLTVNIYTSHGDLAYEITGAAEDLLQFMDLLLVEGVTSFVVRVASAQEERRLRERFPRLHDYPVHVSVVRED